MRVYTQKIHSLLSHHPFLSQHEILEKKIIHGTTYEMMYGLREAIHKQFIITFRENKPLTRRQDEKCFPRTSHTAAGFFRDPLMDDPEIIAD